MLLGSVDGLGVAVGVADGDDELVGTDVVQTPRPESNSWPAGQLSGNGIEPTQRKYLASLSGFGKDPNMAGHWKAA